MALTKYSKTGFVFLDLPSELRYQIYRCILVEDKPIRLTTKRCYRADVSRGHRKLDKNVHSVRDSNQPRKRRAVRPQNAHTAILATSRQIRNEAMPMLYADNHFSFKRASDLGDFLDAIGQRAQHVRYVEIRSGGLHKEKTRYALQKLYLAKSLRKLTLHHTDICILQQRTGKLDAIIRDCVGLVRFLQQSYAKQALHLNPLDVIAVHLSSCVGNTPQPCKFGSLSHAYLPSNGMFRNCKCPRLDIKQRHADLQESFRRTMASALERYILEEENRKRSVEHVVSTGYIDPRLLALSS